MEELSGGATHRFSYPLVLEPRGAISYFEARAPFNPMSIFANPMMLMMGFSMLMVRARHAAPRRATSALLCRAPPPLPCRPPLPCPPPLPCRPRVLSPSSLAMT